MKTRWLVGMLVACTASCGATVAAFHMVNRAAYLSVGDERVGMYSLFLTFRLIRSGRAQEKGYLVFGSLSPSLPSPFIIVITSFPSSDTYT